MKMWKSHFFIFPIVVNFFFFFCCSTRLIFDWSQSRGNNLDVNYMELWSTILEGQSSIHSTQDVHKDSHSWEQCCRQAVCVRTRPFLRENVVVEELILSPRKTWETIFTHSGVTRRYGLTWNIFYLVIFGCTRD